MDIQNIVFHQENPVSLKSVSSPGNGFRKALSPITNKAHTKHRGKKIQNSDQKPKAVEKVEVDTKTQNDEIKDLQAENEKLKELVNFFKESQESETKKALQINPQRVRKIMSLTRENEELKIQLATQEAKIVESDAMVYHLQHQLEEARISYRTLQNEKNTLQERLEEKEQEIEILKQEASDKITQHLLKSEPSRIRTIMRLAREKDQLSERIYEQTSDS